MFNLMTEPLFRFDQSGKPRSNASLPQVYAALMANEVDAFPALRPHQRHAWHAFLVQLGAMAMHHAGLSQPPGDADEWQALIRGLTPDWPGDEPWQLVIDEITKPAFMQPPASSQEREKEYKSEVSTPDELDMLVTSKNHDLKSSVATQASVDDWVFALVSLQTMEGFGGKSNYGISRMPSGYGNRSAFSITPSIRLGLHIRRDIVALMEHRQAILEEYPMIDKGIGLLWVLPWDGTNAEMLLINQMEPFYIEICRRVRLQYTDNQLSALRTTSGGRRIADFKGLTGDPWMPVSNSTNPRGTPPAFLGSSKKFGYEHIVEGLHSSEWKLPYLLKSIPYDRNSGATMELVARGMVRGEGRTKGYHERVISLRPKVAQAFGSPISLKELDDIARERVENVGKVKNILRDAIATFIVKGNNLSSLKAKDRQRIGQEAQPWSDKLDEIVDSRFFDDLQTEFEEDNSTERERIRKQWLHNGKDGVIDHASKILQDSEDALPCRTVRHYKARVQADAVFWGRLKGTNGLPFVFASFDEEKNECLSNSQPQPQTNLEERQMPLFQ